MVKLVLRRISKYEYIVPLLSKFEVHLVLEQVQVHFSWKSSCFLATNFHTDSLIA